MFVYNGIIIYSGHRMSTQWQTKSLLILDNMWLGYGFTFLLNENEHLNNFNASLIQRPSHITSTWKADFKSDYKNNKQTFVYYTLFSYTGKQNLITIYICIQYSIEKKTLKQLQKTKTFFFIINVRQKSHRPSPRYKNNGGPVGS